MQTASTSHRTHDHDRPADPPRGGMTYEFALVGPPVSPFFYGILEKKIKSVSKIDSGVVKCA